MITFLYGSYGTGKSAYIMEQIRRDASEKRRAFWLVPEQRAVICERNLARALPPSAQLFCEVLNFTRLANKVFRLYGGLKYNYVSKSGRSLVMYRALCEVRENLREYKLVKGREQGCVSVFLDAIGELKSYGVSPEALLEASHGVENMHLKQRILDLVCVFNAYEQIMSEKYSDSYDDVLTLEKKLTEHSFFEGASVYINSFNGFTGAQMGVLRHIISQAENVTVSLDMTEADAGKIQYAKLSRTATDLVRLCRQCGKEYKTVVFDTDLLHSSPSLSYLCDNIWRFDAEEREDDGSICLMRPADEFEECEAVASKIKQLVMDGAKYSDIAVVMRSCDSYRGIIDYVFEKYEIPFYLSADTGICSRPLVKMLFSAISASQSWSVRDVATFIRSGFSGIDDEACDALEDYIYRWGIYGSRFENDDYWSANPDGYITEPTEAQMARLAKINDTRARIIKMISPLKSAFSSGATASELCLCIYNFICSLGVRDTLEAQMKESTKSEAMELSQLYSAVIDALESISEVMPSEPLTRQGFVDALSFALDGVSIGTIPTGEDNVTIGEAGALRVEQIKHAFVLGVCEGVFPMGISQQGFFSDSDKLELETVGILLSARGDERADDELLHFKASIGVASESLTVSAPRADIRGGKKEPSIAYNRILELFPSLKGKQEVKFKTQDKLYTERVAREHASGASESAQAVRELFGIERACFDFSNENQSISREGAVELFGKNIYLSQSKVENFVSCHFQYYCSYLLDLKESEKITFGAREVGILAHSVFEHFLKRARESGSSIGDMTEAEIEREIDDITEDYIRTLATSACDSRLRHLFKRLRNNIIVYVRELASELAQSKFVPELFELKFSKDSAQPLKFDAGDGATVTMSGVVDRVDIYREDDTAYVRVVDYKTGDKRFNFDEFNNGLELQLLIYLFTLCKSKNSQFRERLLGGASRLKPAGVLYFPMRLGKSKIDAEVDLSSPEASIAETQSVCELVRRNGLFLDNESVLLAQDKDLSGKYVPKKHAKNKQYFLSEDELEALFGRMCDILHGIGSSMLAGDASAKALKLKGQNRTACEYCKHRAMCRRREK